MPPDHPPDHLPYCRHCVDDNATDWTTLHHAVGPHATVTLVQCDHCDALAVAMTPHASEATDYLGAADT